MAACGRRGGCIARFGGELPSIQFGKGVIWLHLWRRRSSLSQSRLAGRGGRGVSCSAVEKRHVLLPLAGRGGGETEEKAAFLASPSSRWCCLGQNITLMLICLRGRGDGESIDAQFINGPYWRSEKTLVPSFAAPKGFHLPIIIFFLEMALWSSCCTKDQLRIAVKAICAFFISLGCVRRRQVRSSLLSLPRFGDEDSVLSSVKHPKHLQLNFQPRVLVPSQLLVEPLAFWMDRLYEALEELICRFGTSMFSMDTLVGSICVLRLGQLSVIIFSCVLLDYRFDSDL
jgi:hypothetical protein